MNSVISCFISRSLQVPVSLQRRPPPLGESADAAAAKYYRQLLVMKRQRHRMACETMQLLASEALLRRSQLEQEMRQKGFQVPTYLVRSRIYLSCLQSCVPK